MTGSEAIKEAVLYLREDQRRDREGIGDIVFEPEVIECEQRMDARAETIERLLILEGEERAREECEDPDYGGSR
jgi:hypothetical protein